MEKKFGYKALNRMAGAPRFNYWMYQTIKPFIGGKILEAGSGIGNLSVFFINDHVDIALTDCDADCIELLKRSFPTYPAEKIFQLDLADPCFKKIYKSLANSYHSVFLLNVLEHIEDDLTAIENCKYLLKPGGSLLILVPSYSFLYSKMDRLLGHYRRYTPSSLNEVIKKNDLEIRKTFFFNALGIAGWWWNKIFHQAEISATKMNIYNTLVPFAKILDKLVFHKIGLSVITIARKHLS